MPTPRYSRWAVIMCETLTHFIGSRILRSSRARLAVMATARRAGTWLNLNAGCVANGGRTCGTEGAPFCEMPLKHRHAPRCQGVVHS